MLKRGLESVGALLQPEAKTEAVVPMVVTQLTLCPKIGHIFEMLGPHFGKKGPPHTFWKKCSEATGQYARASDVRGMIAGSAMVVVGINTVGHEATMLTLLAASRSCRCAVVMTLEGFRGFADFMDAMPDGDRGFLGSRIATVITVGDEAECFLDIKRLVFGARMRHIGGLTWSVDTCADIASLICNGPTKA